MQQKAFFLQTKLKSEIETTHSEILRRLQSVFQTQEGTRAKCLNWLKSAEIMCLPVA